MWGSRQDHKADGRVPITAKWMVDVMQVSEGIFFRRFAAFDMHAKQHQRLFDIPADNLSASPYRCVILKIIYSRISTTEARRKRNCASWILI